MALEQTAALNPHPTLSLVKGEAKRVAKNKKVFRNRKS
jgi:hypothetical protein